MVIPAPPSPFRPQTLSLASGTGLYRVLSNRHRADEFNPGFGSPTRFAFFGDPTVPVLYCAQTPEAAVCETLLHDVPVEGGHLRPRAYRDKLAVRLTPARELRLASFLGTGLRALKTEASQLTDTDPREYPSTVKWAEATHRAGFDGIAWMSKRCNSDQAYVLFGDRVIDCLIIDPSYGRVFAAGKDLDWLINFCAPLHVEVLVHG